MPGALRVHGESIKLARQPDSKIGDVDGFLDLALSLSENFAYFQTDQGPEIVFVFAESVAHFTYDFSSLWGRKHSPFLEDFFGVHGTSLVVLSVRQAH
jgi:hypothetical protein